MSKGAICYSGAPSQNSFLRLGTPHYSYRFAEKKFLRCLQGLGFNLHFLNMPEYYSSETSYADLPTYRKKYIHLIFRSTEEIRILKNGYNIIWYAWEFPYIKDFTEANEHPFLNQKRMLSLCDEIWVPCEFTRCVLTAHGLDNVHRIPAPIMMPDQNKTPRSACLAILGHINTQPFKANFLGNSLADHHIKSAPLYAAFSCSRASFSRKVYLSIFNPEDFRKNLDALVRGFDVFQQNKYRDDLLIIKALTSADRFSLDQVISNVMLAKLEPGSAIANQNIIVVNDFLSDDEMVALYDLADFYVCTSIAEGQNLPLQEAMARGVVPITTRNTAMLDYIDEKNSVVIATKSEPNRSEHLAGNIAGKPYNIDVCRARQVADALEVASSKDVDELAQMSANARERIVAHYSCQSLERHLAARIEDITAR